MEASAIIGALAGAVLSLVVGAVILWVKRVSTNRDRTAHHSAQLAGITATIQGVDQRLGRIESKLDGLPCSVCPPAIPVERRAHG